MTDCLREFEDQVFVDPGREREDADQPVTRTEGTPAEAGLMTGSSGPPHGGGSELPFTKIAASVEDEQARARRPATVVISVPHSQRPGAEK